MNEISSVPPPAATVASPSSRPQEGSSADSGTAGIGVLSPKDKLEALMLSKMNEEKAELCSNDQPALKRFFEMNAAFLLRVAQ